MVCLRDCSVCGIEIRRGYWGVLDEAPTNRSRCLSCYKSARASRVRSCGDSLVVLSEHWTELFSDEMYRGTVDSYICGEGDGSVAGRNGGISFGADGTLMPLRSARRRQARYRSI